MKKRIVFSPHRNKQFLVSGANDLKLYQWDQNSDEDIHLIASNSNLNQMKCFDWASQKEVTDLIAVGYTSGRVIVTNFDSFTFPNSLSNLSLNTSSSSLSKLQSDINVICEFSPRIARTCNVVSFCPTDSRLLLTGLDKVRNDFCLMVYDIEHSSRSLFTNNTSTINSPLKGPLTHSISPLDLTAKAKVLSPNNDILNRVSLGENDEALLPDNIPKVIGSNPISQYGSSEAVSSADWFRVGNPTIVAGMGYKWIRIYDTRFDGNQSSNFVIPTKAVLGITVDPFFPLRFASFADDGIARLWDTRKASEPILVLNPEFRNGIDHISWSPNRSGSMLAVGKDSPNIKIWDIIDQSTATSKILPADFSNCQLANENSPLLYSAHNSNANDSPEYSNDSPEHLPFSENNDQTLDKSTIHPMVPLVWRIRQVVTQEKSAILSSSWIPNSSDFPIRILSCHLMRDNKFETTILHNVANFSWSPLGELAVVEGGNINTSGISSNCSGNSFQDAVMKELQGDISVEMIKRAKLGYSNTNINLSLFKDGGSLHELWAWIFRNKENASNLQLNSINYSFEGILTVIRDMIANSTPQKSTYKKKSYKISQRKLGYDSSMSPKTPSNLDKSTSVESIDDQLTFVGTYAENNYRKLALCLCGWDFPTPDGFLNVLKSLESEGEFEKAAGYALFHHGNITLAIEALNRSNNEKLKLVAVVLAGYSTMVSTLNEANPWKESCRMLSNELENPYIRAIFALISTSGDWYSVLAEKGLSLKDRVGIALRFLSDEELEAYVSENSRSMSKDGILDGLLLTGLNKPFGVELIAKYVDRTGDIQTAALIFGCFVSVSFRDSKIDEWTDCYRTLLDQWKLYHVRAKYDIARRKLLNTLEEEKNMQQNSITTNAPPVPYTNPFPISQPQIAIKCNFCNQPITTGIDSSSCFTPMSKTSSSSSSHSSHGVKNASGPIVMGGAGGGGINVAPGISSAGGAVGGVKHHKMTSCPNCKKALPRCALCLLNMGTPAEKKTCSSSSVELTKGFNSWFTWCQTCKHGGHTLHMIGWFENHKTCPVTDCVCLCVQNI